MNDAAASADEPRMTPPQPDQILMEAVDVPAVRRQLLGVCRKSGANGIVAAGALLLDAAKCLFVSSIDTRRPADGEKDRQSVGNVPFVVQLARQPRHVMVADKCKRRECLKVSVVAVERPCQFEKIAIVEGAPDRLPKLILCDGIDAGVANERRIVTMNDFTENVGARVTVLHFRQHIGPK